MIALKKGLIAGGVILLLGAGYRILPMGRVEPWTYWADSEAAGFSEDSLAVVSDLAHAAGTTGMVVVSGGRVVMEYGNVEQRGYLGMARSSLLALLFGTAVAEGSIDMEWTLAEIGIDDRSGLLESEKRATIEQVLTGRSGVFHPSSFKWDRPETPERGSVEPGSSFFDHWWTNLAACGIYEILTGRDFFWALHESLGKPLGLQSYNPGRHMKYRFTSRSGFQIYDIYLSARDIARFGQLMLQKGEWKGQQLVPAEWVERITTLVTPRDEIAPERLQERPLGFGYQWWVWDDAEGAAVFEGAYTFIGDYGQYLTVIPRLDMVVAHQVKAGGFAPEDGVTWKEYEGILRALSTARSDAISSN
jgi:CubicO group peptidase (beta-lactamase class C family)